jgi:hypothetical protein
MSINLQWREYHLTKENGWVKGSTGDKTGTQTRVKRPSDALATLRYVEAEVDGERKGEFEDVWRDPLRHKEMEVAKDKYGDPPHEL